ncbi:large conductance mechanosensitive channel protein MscL [Thermomonospora umbrina]|uniref:Large conductance mechanosensitive channel n=1 Tax=Thermomonospora umbrina TaxID=111806 RepID=A0A3D9SUJ8_9ACTN|nr:large conductance mechanosensitive channel protein MscL [Thermomonospora umbrina]REE96234.1 large conductance mechanosensitive channel [Thermomonospora umbrina]
MEGFKKFLLRGNLVELAVAVVVGAAFGSLVTSFVTAFITPLIALIGGEPDHRNLAFTVNETKFPYGIFLTSVISFLIIAAVVYFFVVLPVGKLLERFKRKVEATVRDCPHCYGEIPLRASRCQFCTSEIEPVAT